MPETVTDVVLVTTDSQLRELIGRHRPPLASLRCVTASELADASPVRARQVWVDLDTAGVVDIPAGVRRVYFYSQRHAVPEGLPVGLFIRKPCSKTVFDVLWADVGRVPTTVATPIAAAPPPPSTRLLPAWLLEFQEIRLPTLCRKLITGLAPRLGYRHASLYLHHPERGVLSLVETTQSRLIERSIPMDATGKNLMVAIARAGRVFKTEHVSDERTVRGIPQLEGSSYEDNACLVAPLCSDGDLWGVLNLSERQPTALTEQDLPLDEIFAFLGRALQQARAYDQARTEARIDSLTGLYNQRWIIESLDKEIRRAERFATPLSVLMIDLDELKAINDQHGHAAGDCVLRHVADRIGHVLRQFDGAARVGGDEFVVMLPATNLRGAQRVARRLGESIAQAAPDFRDARLRVSASIGVAEWQAGWSGSELLDAADRAMYDVKQGGRGGVSVHPNGTTPEWPQPKPSRKQRTPKRELPAQ